MTKISALSDIGTGVASNDAFVLVDVSDPTTPNKKIQQQNLFLIPDGSAVTPAVRFLNDTDVGLFRPTTNTLAFATGGSERLRIDSSGRVGLGNSSPSYKLDVSVATNDPTTGSPAAGSFLQVAGGTTTVGNGPSISLANTSGAKETFWRMSAVTASGNNGDLVFNGYNGGVNYPERLRITAAGNVGIGTTSPSALLSVYQSAAGEVANFGTNDPTRLLRIVTGTASGIGGALITLKTNSAEGEIAFGTGGGNERARIDKSGRLLVGTSSALTGTTGSYPSQFSKLVSLGNSSNNNGAFVAFGYGQAGTALGAGVDIATINFTDNANGQFAQIRCDTDAATAAGDFPGRLVFSTTADGASSPTERMRIKNNGTINFSNVSVYADNAAATTGGLAVGDVYRTATGQLMIRY